jgi:hypothetical protein
MGATLLALLALEGGARVTAKLALRDRGLRFDSELGWWHLPNVRKTGFYWSANEPGWTNSKGLRDIDYTYARPAGVGRAVALGDSFTFGVGVDYGQRYTEFLENAIANFEVVNFGCNAYGTDQELRLLETEALRYDPDVVIVLVYLGNDVDDITYRRRYSWPKPYFELEGDVLRLVRPQPGWDIRLRTTSYLGEIVLSRLIKSAQDSIQAPYWKDRDSLPLFRTLAVRIGQVAAARGAPVLFVLAYPRERVSESPTERERNAHLALRDAGLHVLDTHRLFADRAAAGENLYVDGDIHWNSRGHELVATAIRDRLLTEGWIPEP